MVDFEPLLEAASQALANAYAPYSRLRVGAAVLTEAGGMYSGCNVENAAFPIGGCAEHHAIAAAVRAEGPGMRLRAVAIGARDAAGAAVAIPPCGACRQLIHEFGGAAEVAFLGHRGEMRRFAIGELLPQSFSLAAPGA